MSSGVFWQQPRRKLTIFPQEIHIWKVKLTSWNDWSVQVLSKEELNKAYRFIQAVHQRRFALARGHLRVILGKYTGVSPTEIRFQEGAHGKLFLADNPLMLQFNLSHSEDIAVYAFTLQQEVGIDIEWINSSLEIVPLIKRFFAAEEQQAILNLPIKLQHQAFFNYWTRKEAYLKALGVGLSGLSDLTAKQIKTKTKNFQLEASFASAVASTEQIADYNFFFFNHF
ncbi:MAG: 4'-phosphopantetheinyl transferase superfamily protein [Proteobacteria bacterium]|nr:4'-phosphopantetheinyl transferase superfamily protein [Pseudomonadota bacterium]